MKTSYQVAMVTALTLSAALLLAPAPGQGQFRDRSRTRQLTVFDRGGNVVNTIGEQGMYHQPSFSPDRTRVAVVTRLPNSALWVLDVATGNRTQITSGQRGERAYSPVWSPDGSQIAYVAVRGSDYGLYRQASDGEGEEELLYQHLGGWITLTDWSLDGRFLGFFAADFFYSTNLSGSTLYLLPLDGDGQATEVARSESTMVEARLSPDRRFLAYRSDETGRGEIFVRSVALSDGTNTSAEQWQVSTEGGLGMASWRRDGQELYYFGADRGVMAVDVNTAQGFEFGQPRRLFKAPDAIPVNHMIGENAMGFHGAYGNVSRDGQRFLFAVPPALQLRQITVFDREGDVVSRPGEPGLYAAPALSRDGSRVAVLKHDLETGNEDVWTFDVSTGEGMPVTSDESRKFKLVWSPDGAHVAYVSPRGRYLGIYRTASNGQGSEELLFRYTLGADMILEDFSADGRFLSIESGGVVLVVPLTGTDPLAQEAIDFVRDEFESGGGWFSPDSGFIAYRSTESGRFGIYVRPFDPSSRTVPAEGKWQVSEDAAMAAHWRQDGQELFYLALSGKMMAVDVTTVPEFQVGTPRLLFRVRDLPGIKFGGRAGMGLLHGSSLRPDGLRFVLTIPAEGG